MQLGWEAPTYFQAHYAEADKRRHQRRLKRVAVASKTWSAAGAREMVRAYNLRYFVDRTVPGSATQSPVWNRSYLRQIDARDDAA